MEMTEEQKDQLIEARELQQGILVQVDQLLSKSVTMSMALAYQVNLMVEIAYKEKVHELTDEARLKKAMEMSKERGWGRMVEREDTQVFQPLSEEDFR